MRRTVVLSVVLVLGLCGVWIQAAQQGERPAPAGSPQSGQPAPINPDNFTGKVTPHLTSDIRTLRYRFDPGARTNWHSHAGGQVIYIEEGRMLSQERGKPAKEFAPGDTFRTLPNVAHWHGALPTAGLTQVALSFGMTTWMEKVSDEEYARVVKR